MSILAVWLGTGWALEPAEEVTHLLGYLKRSNCRFNRNGTWYSGSDAASHIRQKYDYLLQRQLVSSAEGFIDLAASRSSLSGQSYVVSCPGSAEIESALWFRRELNRFRRTHMPSPTTAEDE